MIRILFLILFHCLLVSNNLFGQAQAVGINTQTPEATLDVNSTMGNTVATNALLVESSDTKTLFNVKDNGYVGVGMNNPSVILDLRDAGNSAVGIGWTTMTAPEAGVGAIRYNSASQNMEYSDGSRWVVMQSIRPKAVVLAHNWTNSIVLPDSDYVQLGSWNATTDRLGNFDAATGVFTAPRDGVYSATFTIDLRVGRITRAGSVLQAIWRTSTGQQTVNTVPYMTVANGVQNAVVISTTFSLSQGEMLYPVVFHNLGVQRELRVNATGDDGSSEGFNNIYIVEY